MNAGMAQHVDGGHRQQIARREYRVEARTLFQQIGHCALAAAGREIGGNNQRGLRFAFRVLQCIGKTLKALHDFGQIPVAQKDNVAAAFVEQVARRDVSLCLKLLRMANSAAFGKKGRVDSIQHALSMLGLSEVRKWIALLTLAGLAEGKPAELIRATLVRARFCEEVAESLASKSARRICS